MDRGSIRRANALDKRWPLWNHPDLRKSSTSSSNNGSNNNNNTGGVEAIFVDPTTIFVCDIEDQSTTGHLVDSSPRKSDQEEKQQQQQRQEQQELRQQHQSHDDPRKEASFKKYDSSLPRDHSTRPPFPNTQSRVVPKRDCIAKETIKVADHHHIHKPVVGKDKKFLKIRSQSNEENSCNHHDGFDTPRPRTDSKDSSFPSGIYSEPTLRRGNITAAAAAAAAAASFDHTSCVPARGGGGRGERVIPPPRPCKEVAVPSKVATPVTGCRTNITLEIAQAWVQMGKGEAAPPPPPPLKMIPPSSWCSTNANMLAALPLASSSYRVRRRTLRELFGGGRAVEL